MVTLQLRQLEVPLGVGASLAEQYRLRLHNIDWPEFEAILAELGDRRASRIAYSHRLLEIRMPLPEHAVEKELISDLIKIVLDALDIEYECFGSTTFKHPGMASGIEPDQCFYIQNQSRMRGKRRLDLTLDPPPDLALEVDVTSKTQLDAYVRLGVPELWVYDQGTLRIYVLTAGEYRPVANSPTFPGLAIADLVAEVLAQSLTIGRSRALRALRARLYSTMDTNRIT